MRAPTVDNNYDRYRSIIHSELKHWVTPMVAALKRREPGIVPEESIRLAFGLCVEGADDVATWMARLDAWIAVWLRCFEADDGEVTEALDMAKLLDARLRVPWFLAASVEMCIAAGRGRLARPHVEEIVRARNALDLAAVLFGYRDYDRPAESLGIGPEVRQAARVMLLERVPGVPDAERLKLRDWLA